MRSLIPLYDTLRMEKMSDDEYFGEKYRHYVSNSRLSRLKKGKEAFFGRDKEYTFSMHMGSVIHQMALQPESYELARSMCKPLGKTGYVADDVLMKYRETKEITDKDIVEACDRYSYYPNLSDSSRVRKVRKESEKYWEEMKDTVFDRTPLILHYMDYDTVTACLKSIKYDFSCYLRPKGLLEDPVSLNETAFFLDILVKGEGKDMTVRFKSKLDNVIFDKENNRVTVNDLKTTGRPDFEKTFSDFSYDRELSIYSWLAGQVAEREYGMKDCTIDAKCLVVCYGMPYGTGVRRLKKEDFKRGWDEFKSLMSQVAQYMEEGNEL